MVPSARFEVVSARTVARSGPLAVVLARIVVALLEFEVVSRHFGGADFEIAGSLREPSPSALKFRGLLF
jgi:hypothetical protein